DITRANLLDWSAFALRPPKAGSHDKSLSKRMRVPCGARSGFESYASALHEGGIGCLEKRIDTYAASEPLRRSLGRRLRACSLYFHLCAPFVVCALSRNY